MVEMYNEEQMFAAPPNRGKDSPVPLDVEGFNFGVFWGLPLIWAIVHKVWAPLIFFALSFVPLVNILTKFLVLPIFIYFGFRGNKWAWQNNNWKSIADFHRVQRLWGICSTVTAIAIISIAVILVNATSASAPKLGETVNNLVCKSSKSSLETAYMGKNFDSAEALLKTAFDYSKGGYDLSMEHATPEATKQRLSEQQPKIVGNSLIEGPSTMRFFAKGSCEPNSKNCGVAVVARDAEGKDKIVCRFYIENGGKLIEVK